MASLIVSIIRHAEKPGEGWPGPGLTPNGATDDESLVVRGWQRAGAWAALFGALGGAAYPAPDVIYAANPHRSAALFKKGSSRPHETMIPLAESLRQTVITSWAVGQEDGLATEVIQRSSGTVLICWEHKRIVSHLIPAIVGNDVRHPKEWPAGRYDIVLRAERLAPRTPWRLVAMFPRLLAGDSDKQLPS